MPASVTTSVRLPLALRKRLERRAAALRCGRNRLIVAALEQFLEKEARAEYEAEARRQSILAARLDPPDATWDRMVAEDFKGS
jgi:predicted transcriptional regulator